MEENIHLVACVRRETDDRVWQFVCQRAQHVVRMELAAAAQEKRTKILYRYQACDIVTCREFTSGFFTTFS